MHIRVTLLFLALSLCLAACGGSDGGGTEPLGAMCAADGDCESSHCNAGVCAQCTGNGDCGDGGVCMEDTGSGYHVCVSGSDLANLGDACTDGAECMSGMCNGDVCALCEGDDDCTGGAMCTPGADGYHVCEGGEGGLGDACSGGGECASGFCAGDVCSECETSTDCPDMETCVDDTAGVGHYVCEAMSAPGVLGDTCSDGTGCESGFCMGDVCSECEAATDCPDGGIVAPTCVDDTAGSGYFVCDDGLGDLGVRCVSGAECSSSHCFLAFNDIGICSECTDEMDCAADQECARSFRLGHARCVGVVALGEACEMDTQCTSGVCDGAVCAECRGDGDCDGGGTCTAGPDYMTCEGGLGSTCTMNDECNSTKCFLAQEVCSECAEDMDCPEPQVCSYRFFTGYAACRGTELLGEPCADDLECISGFCNSGVCSQCGGDDDCTDSRCIDSADRGYFLCERTLGRSCEADVECTSTHCFVQGFLNVCSECADDENCGVDQTCEYDSSQRYASCVGTLGLGDPCEAPGQCASGLCVGSVCTGCEGDGDCGEGGACVSQGTFSACEGGLGDPCSGDPDCTSGFCHNPQGPASPICSACDDNNDCPSGRCEYSGVAGYALCF